MVLQMKYNPRRGAGRALLFTLRSTSGTTLSSSRFTRTQKRDTYLRATFYNLVTTAQSLYNYWPLLKNCRVHASYLHKHIIHEHFLTLKRTLWNLAFRGLPFTLNICPGSANAHKPVSYTHLRAHET